MKIGFGAIGIKGGNPGNLDYIGVDTFNNKDIAIVFDNNNLYCYRMDAYSGEDENVPYIIKPVDVVDSSPLGYKLKRWKLISQKYITSDIIVPNDNSIYTSTIQASGDLYIESSNNNIITFYSNGNTNFPLTISGLNPIQDIDFTNKEYVDSFLDQSYNYIFNIFNTLFDDFKQDITPTLDTYLKQQLYQLITNVNDYFVNKSNGLTNSTESYLTSASEGLTGSTESYLTSALDTLSNEVSGYVDSGISLLTDYSLSASYSTEPSAYYEDDEDPNVILLGDPYPQYDYVRDIYTIDNWNIPFKSEEIYNHNLNSDNVLVFVYDENLNLINPELIKIWDYDNIELNFDQLLFYYVIIKEGSLLTEHTSASAGSSYSEYVSGGDIIQIYDENDEIIKLESEEEPEYYKIIGIEPDFTLEFTSETDLNIFHGLDSYGILINVYNQDNEKINPKSATLIDENNINVNFDQLISGKVLLTSINDEELRLDIENQENIKNNEICYYNVEHNIGNSNFLYDIWYNNEKIVPINTQFLNDNYIRTIMPISFNNDTIGIVFVYREEK